LGVKEIFLKLIFRGYLFEFALNLVVLLKRFGIFERNIISLIGSCCLLLRNLRLFWRELRLFGVEIFFLETERTFWLMQVCGFLSLFHWIFVL